MCQTISQLRPLALREVPLNLGEPLGDAALLRLEPRSPPALSATKLNHRATRMDESRKGSEGSLNQKATGMARDKISFESH